jgi:hypothetical protein
MQQGCPFLREVNAYYCSAYPVKKLIPKEMMNTPSPCTSAGYTQCPVFKDMVKSTPEQIQETQQIKPIPKGECVWIRQEMVSYRLCTKNYECEKCEFAQMLVERDGRYVESPEVIQQIKQMQELPAPKRICKYVLLEGKISREPCLYEYKCWSCPIYQQIRKSFIEK